MEVFNIEVFDKNFNLLAHANVGKIEYEVDYLSNQVNSLVIPNGFFKKNKEVEGRFGDYIVIRSNVDSYFLGLTTTVEQDLINTTVSFKSILNLFDTTIIVDTDLQGKGTLEKFIEEQIKSNFVENEDVLQNVPGLKIESLSNTFDWGFNFKSDKEGKHTIITNLYKNIIIRSFQKYNVVIDVFLDLKNKEINLKIKENDEAIKTIEADLDNVINRNFSVKRNEQAVNKLIISNVEDYSEQIVYYLHSDGTFDTSNTDRIEPVIAKNVGVDPEEEEKDFSALARSQAFDTFKRNQHNHLIELEILKNDKLINYKDYKIGQNVRIINNGNVYNSVLTGFKIANTVVLKFGNIRLDLTNILKRGFFNVD